MSLTRTIESLCQVKQREQNRVLHLLYSSWLIGYTLCSIRAVECVFIVFLFNRGHQQQKGKLCIMSDVTDKNNWVIVPGQTKRTKQGPPFVIFQLVDLEPHGRYVP